MNKLKQYLKSLPYEGCFYLFKDNKKFSVSKFTSPETDRYDRTVMEEICFHLSELGCKTSSVQPQFNENKSEIISLMIEGEY